MKLPQLRIARANPAVNRDFLKLEGSASDYFEIDDAVLDCHLTLLLKCSPFRKINLMPTLLILLFILTLDT